MKQFKLFLTAALLSCLTSVQAQKYVGGDISLLPTYEEHGANYMDKDGKKISDMLAFLKEQGLNAMRVRLFVDPSLAPDEAKGQGVRQDLEYVKKLGKRIKDAGLQFMLDFHYSDTWADPGQQATPESFKMLPALAEELTHDYTKQCLKELNEAGATPDFIQTGNEISFGMLWDSRCKVEANSDWNGYTDTNWDHFTTVLKNAIQACREMCPEAKIILHTEQCANNPTLDVAFFKRIKDNKVDYDIIGTSYYPYYKGLISNLDKGLTQLETNFPDKQIMVVETGCGYHYKMGDQDTGYPLTYDGQKDYTADLITMLKKHPNVNGLFWWFLEANEYGLDWATKRVTDKWYDASLFDNETGKALPALYELKNFDDGSTGIRQITTKDKTNDSWYSLDGRQLPDKPSAKGIYIKDGQKMIIK
ncbi:MAG: glycosyl hydrolase 53 family protein [Prevotella sp.]|nr:glycosyl hydrolase 53 family protein [Prevotella sp.]